MTGFVVQGHLCWFAAPETFIIIIMLKTIMLFFETVYILYLLYFLLESSNAFIHAAFIWDRNHF